jgi:hypothetical protein
LAILAAILRASSFREQLGRRSLARLHKQQSRRFAHPGGFAFINFICA